jgi:two-component system chemotaxis sensor kinase CheA
MDEILEEFLIESYENLDQVDEDLIELEKTPDDQARLNNIFRTIHTIKGTTGFLGLNKLESLTHVGENLLDELRDGRRASNRETTDVLLALADAVRSMLAAIEASGEEGSNDHDEIRRRIREMLDGGSKQAEPSVESNEENLANKEANATTSAPSPQHLEPHDASDDVEHEDDDEDELEPRIASSANDATKPASEARSAQQNNAGNQRLSETSVRVDVELLDKLMNLVGELVLARNRILQFSSFMDHPELVGASQTLNLLTSELQEGVMKARMQPVGNILKKVPRMVRDLSHSLGKKIEIEMEGTQTELDRTLMEVVRDPLTHIIRNAVDHGIEAPEAREAMHKSPTGMIRIRAYHEGGQVNIEISDDGAGLDVRRLKAKALENGIYNTEQLQNMSDREALELIFHPGLSTANAVTNVSGRGVGMDVVKTQMEKIGGMIEIQSSRGSGTTFRLKIPLTLAIIPALIVATSDDLFAIPQMSLVELVRVERDRIEQEIESVYGAPVYRLRGELLPLISLDEVLGGAAQQHNGDEDIYIVVVQGDHQQFGLVVRDVYDTEEIVVKPLGKYLKSIPYFAGATIMGDGRVTLILDTMGLAQEVGVLDEKHHHASAEEHHEKTREAREETLLLRSFEGTRYACALAQVARLEEFSANAFEEIGGGYVIQYRGDVLPLVCTSEIFGTGPWSPPGEGLLHVVVLSREGQTIGLVVEQILDIVEVSSKGMREGKRAGIRAVSITNGNVIEHLDVDALFDITAKRLGGALHA